MLLAITIGIGLAIFIMLLLWCRAAMRAASRQAEAAAKRKLDGQSWAALKAARRQTQNDHLDRMAAATEASKPILSAPRRPLPPKATVRPSAAKSSVAPTSRSRSGARAYDYDDTPARSSSSYDYGSSYSGGSDSSYSSGGSCSSSSSSSDSGGGGGGGGGCD